MSAPNNRSTGLIAYGGRAPGGADHAVFADLPGQWRRGFIDAYLYEPPFDFGPGQGHQIEAWLLELPPSEDKAATWRELHERWVRLDGAMGEEWGPRAAP